MIFGQEILLFELIVNGTTPLQLLIQKVKQSSRNFEVAYGLNLTYMVFAHFQGLLVLLKRILDSAVLHVEVPDLNAFLCMSHLLFIVPPVSDLVNLSKLHFDDLVLFEAQFF